MDINFKEFYDYLDRFRLTLNKLKQFEQKAMFKFKDEEGYSRLVDIDDDYKVVMKALVTLFQSDKHNFDNFDEESLELDD